MLGSTGFFRIIVALLALQAAWIALSGRYPMAFDEDFHLGIIRLYAHHISPFWSSQPAGADAYGAVARDPSYLYQYLMSFPYRLISLFTGDQTIQVILLRFINIGLFASGLALYRRLLLKTGASRAIIHVCLLFFVLIPIVPLLAAQINYDNMFLPATALALLLTLRFDSYLTKRHRVDAKTGLLLLIVCFLASLVKYVFLPIFAVIAGFVAVRIWQYRRPLPEMWRDILAAWRQLGTGLRLGLIVGVVLTAGLFLQRYSVNLLRYHSPVPDCSKVLTVKQCSQYGPWIRNYDDKLIKVDNDLVPGSLPTFAADWLYGMWLRTFFAVGGLNTDFETRGPLLIPGLSAIVFTVIGGLAVLAGARRLWRKYNSPVLWLFAAVTVIYVSALWLDDYQAFLQTSQPVAINGRYLLPVFLPVFLIAALAVKELIGRRQNLRLAAASVAVVCMLWGGGALTFVLRSNDSWYWPSPVVRTANHAVKHVLGPIMPGYKQPTLFLH